MYRYSFSRPRRSSPAGEQDGVQIAAAQFIETRLHVAAHGFDLQVGTAVQ